MNDSRFPRLARRLLWLMALTIMALSLSLGRLTLSADSTAEDQPAAEGREITPAGSLLLDLNTRQPAVGALAVDFVRSPDRTGPEGQGRYLIAVNSGFGLQFNSATNRAQQSLAVIDLAARPEPVVIQNVYFPAPQSVNVGVCFAPEPEADGSFPLYVAGGVENKIWVFSLRPGQGAPITPVSAGPNTSITAPFIDVSAFATNAPSPRYNNDRAPVYPTGLAISPSGAALFVANNLGDSLGIINDLRGTRRLERIDLLGQREARPSDGLERFIYPYGVVVLPARSRDPSLFTNGNTEKVYVSCWNDASVAVVDPLPAKTHRVTYIPVARHPTAMILNRKSSRLYVVNSNADSVSVIDTATDREIERINVRLAEGELIGSSPEGLALSADESRLYVANAHSNSVAVVALSSLSTGREQVRHDEDHPHRSAGKAHRSRKLIGSREIEPQGDRSKILGLIPAGQYPCALAVAARRLFISNGKGTGLENSSVVVNNSGRTPNIANDRFPTGTGRAAGQGGQYSVSLVAGNISVVNEPDERELARYTQQVMRNNHLFGQRQTKLFRGPSPIKHIIYLIKENRTYDQVFGDLARSGNGQIADGDPTLAIFGAGEAARRPAGPAQNISPNHRALALRFGLLDRFFVNSEASPDGHNWSTAAFSNDYVDKAYRWDYGGRGRTYDYEGFNRLPNYEPTREAAPLFRGPVGAEDIANYLRRFIPYLRGLRDVAEPETLYLWDAAARAGLTYRNYGEFVSTLSEADVAAVNANRPKSYPDISPTVSAFPTKKSLEGRYSTTFRNFDMLTPDALTADSYRTAKGSSSQSDPAILRNHPDPQFRGNSRLGEWLEEFQGYAADLVAGRADRLPNLSIIRFSNDHTAGLQRGMPTPQFFVADNDYAVGRLVETVTNSPYWKDTAIFVVEDDAQDGPDHVDAHRSVALVMSAYNRPGTLVHEFHNTVSLIRTMELLLGLPPMNQLDATAAPMDIFRDQADLRPYKALLPDVALDNLITSAARDAATAYWIKRTSEQVMSHADLADPRALNEIIWFSVRGAQGAMPEVARLPIFDAMRAGMADNEEDEEEMPREKQKVVAEKKHKGGAVAGDQLN